MPFSLTEVRPKGQSAIERTSERCLEQRCQCAGSASHQGSGNPDMRGCWHAQARRYRRYSVGLAHGCCQRLRDSPARRYSEKVLFAGCDQTIAPDQGLSINPLTTCSQKSVMCLRNTANISYCWRGPVTSSVVLFTRGAVPNFAPHSGLRSYQSYGFFRTKIRKESSIQILQRHRFCN